MSEIAAELLHGRLHEWQVGHGARMAGFGGRPMPLQYFGGGVVAEHSAVRTAGGLFHASHLG